MLGEQCEHGQLKRQCPLCEKNVEIKRATALIGALARLIGKACPSASMWDDDGGLADQVDKWMRDHN